MLTTNYQVEPFMSMDCWAFLRAFYKKEFNIDLPEIQVPDKISDRMKMFAEHAEHSNWAETTKPENGDAVLCGRGGKVHHVGVVLKRSGKLMVMHALDNMGVVIQEADMLTNMEAIKFMRHKQRIQR